MRHIEILDKSFKRLAFIDNEIEDGIHFSNDVLSTSIANGVYNLEMDILKDTPQIKYIEAGNYITFLNDNNIRVLLTIIKKTENRNSIYIYCEDTSINIINKIVEKTEKPTSAQNIDYYINHGLRNTGWEIGKNESKQSKILEFTSDETLLSRIRKITEEFNVEFYFEVEMTKSKRPKFYIHIVENRVEGKKGFRISNEDSLDYIDREINLDNIVTKLIVKGKTINDDENKNLTVLPNASTENTNKIGQPTSSKADSSKSSSAGAISTTNWDESWVNEFNMNASDPSWVTGAYIDDFLKSKYPDSPLIGYGTTIKEMSDYFGVSVGAAIGVWAKETTFGRAHPGKVDYNFGCVRWTSGSGYPSVTYAGSKWNKYPDIKTGIAAWFKLIRYNYIELNYIKYDKFLDRYSPSFENNQATFKNLMWGALKAFGYDTSDTITKKNYSKSTDNPTTLDLSSKTNTNTSNNNVTTRYNEMIEKMIKWYKDREGKVTYSMNARSGPNSYDCSSALYSALFYAGFKPQINWLGSTVSLWEDVGTNKLMYQINRSEAKRGDIFLSGAKGAASAGASGHTGVFLNNTTIIHCTYSKNGIATTPQQGWSGSPIYCFRLVNKYPDITTNNTTPSVSTKTEQAVKIALNQVGKRYVYGAVGPNSFDCSGIIYYAYRQAGFNINHRCTTATIQAQQSPFKKISSSEAKRGDLVICNGGSHVAILLGAPNSGAGVVHAATESLGVITQKSLMGPIGYYRVT